MVDGLRFVYKTIGLFWLWPIMLCGCQEAGPKDADGLLKRVLEGDELAIKSVMQHPQDYELQIQLILPRDTTLFSVHHGGQQSSNIERVDYSQGQYFYPASTVKLPVAVMAAEWAELNPKISLITPYRVADDTLTHHLAQDLIDIFTISDNEAYNRLYDLLGRDYVNQRMAELGLGDFRLAHRLSVADAAFAEHPVYYFDTAQGLWSYQAKADRPIDSIKVRGTQKGVGYLQDGHLVSFPMDFSHKNYFPLETMMQFMQVLFPMNCAECPSKFKWSKNTEVFVKTLMSTVPRKQGYDELEYPDGYVKFFFLGDGNQRLDPGLKIYNKVGYAYGTLTDIAYVVDTRNNLHYCLGATLLVNENGIFNDNVYEYDEIGLPFLAQVSKRLHELLLEAKSGG